MAKKPKVLCVFFEGLDNSVIDSQVLSHARVMGALGVAEFEIVCCAWDGESYAKSLARRDEAARFAESPVYVLKAYRPGLPFSRWLNRRLIARFIRERGNSYSHFHARTDYSTIAVGTLAKRFQAGLIWDCRGDSVAELEFSPASFSPFLALKRLVLSRRVRDAAQLADRAIFVSHPLRDRMAPLWGEKPYQVIPCTASNQHFFHDPQLRGVVRSRLGVADDQQLYIYGGSMAPYQKFPETVEMFVKIHEKNPRTVLLVLTRDKEKAETIIKGRDGIVLSSAKIEDMNGYLNAADAAFMLRDRVPTNIVAFPTKFAECGLAGLPVIMSDAVSDAYQMARQVGNIVDLKDVYELKPMPEQDRRKTMEAYQKLVTKQAYAQAYAILYAEMQN